MKCDSIAFSSMYELVYTDLYRFALCMMKHTQDAEDTVSEAVVLAYENIHKLKNQESFKSWIFTILSNVCKKKLKNPNRRESSLEEYEQAGPSDFDFPLDMKKAFYILSEEERFIVALSVFGGYNSREIGDMHNINPNTVRSKRSRALEKMSVVLKG